ncbi:DUF3237 domain-containing protein [Aspergillus glaucus CBS 516.65]|uniref:Scytalone dehydratase n=1 Tax=Aspergillus glaucus CBS 516.65 TaxID=1160497 RepID=A0A1L9VWG9_ASPGL|nr:hypothetical protein ASPGLDRAFT_140586 [Aspergillus glaucus CBS 516.65]OJJ88252.1 hypothetical protein ASPGLDRAFT_140586 [Aspergillus glaucus CBS 516.65]
MLLNYILPLLSLFSFPLTTASQPQTPNLSYLYTAYVQCAGNKLEDPGPSGPAGMRKTIPIVGGNFTGPRLSGQILNVGADWGTTDPATDIFSADTRYNLRTNDGEDIFIRTSGPKSPSGQLHLRVLLETGSKKYYWVNNIVAIGVLTNVGKTANSSLLKIDAWNFASDWNTTKFVNQ